MWNWCILYILRYTGLRDANPFSTISRSVRNLERNHLLQNHLVRVYTVYYEPEKRKNNLALSIITRLPGHEIWNICTPLRQPPQLLGPIIAGTKIKIAISFPPSLAASILLYGSLCMESASDDDQVFCNNGCIDEQTAEAAARARKTKDRPKLTTRGDSFASNSDRPWHLGHDSSRLRLHHDDGNNNNS